MIKKLLIIVIVLITLALVLVIIRDYNLNRTKDHSVFLPATKHAMPDLFAFNYHNPALSTIEGIKITKISSPGVYGYKLMPTSFTTLKRPVVVFGGSEGMINRIHGILLAKAGHPVYALNFFAGETGISTLTNIKLSFFQTALDFIAQDQQALFKQHLTDKSTSNGDHSSSHSELTSNLDYLPDGKVDLLGVSKGAELALALANIYPTHIHKLVLFTPSAYHWQGLDFSKGMKNFQPSWIGAGLEQHFLKFTSLYPVAKMMFKFALGLPLSVYDQYQTVLSSNSQDLQASLLPVNHINFPVLIFAGERDQIWPGVEMARTLKSELGNKATLVIYPQAGHLFLGPSVIERVAVGGEYQANVDALIDSNKKVLAFLTDKD